ncbi:YggS family pyridoxal phosphate-dependent enzyme [Hyphobacterium sp.]|uniref:YggS family pyridoxal phosphate-dependent enzyme n=1 Tax=Hyphobacterium sp. TaxID=2004662 RepID=UPI003BAD82F8
MTDLLDEFSTRRNEILSSIAKSAQDAGRPAGAIQLVGISKKQPEARIEAALSAGHRIFGENRVQEAEQRWIERRAMYPDLELRLVGPLQTNKADQAVALFDVIETVDRIKLARALKKAMDKLGRSPRLYVQVNTGEEDQKAGVAPRDAAAFLKQVREAFGFQIEGLMCIPPAEEPAGPHFALLADLAAANGVEKLSMGMSGDYETAVKFGATSVRVGSALFGERPSA